MTQQGSKARPKVVLTRTWPGEVERAMAEVFDLVPNATDEAFTQAELAQALDSADAVCPTVTDALGASVFSDAARARVIGNFGVGYNHIDLDSASAHGIVVTNTPDVLTDCTADLAMTLILMAARRAGEGERALRAGDWHGWYPTHMLGTHVSGKRLGIVGMGRIGRATAHRAHHGFGMQISYHNRHPLPEQEAAALNATFEARADDLFASCDFVSLHCPSTPETRHLADRRRIGLMRPDAFLINTARGDVVDEAALAEALTERRIGGAGLDVYEQEPRVHPALMALNNATLLPHMGSGSRETRVAMGMRVFANLRAFFDGADIPDRVV